MPVGLDDHRIARLLAIEAGRRRDIDRRVRDPHIDVAVLRSEHRDIDRGTARHVTALAARIAIALTIERVHRRCRAGAHVEVRIAIASQRDHDARRIARLVRTEDLPVACAESGRLVHHHRRAELRRIRRERIGLGGGPTCILLLVRMDQLPHRTRRVADPIRARDALRLILRIDRGEIIRVALRGPILRKVVERGRVPCEAGIDRRRIERCPRRARIRSEVAIQLLEHALEIIVREPRRPRGHRESRIRERHRREDLADDVPRRGSPRRDRTRQLLIARGEREIGRVHGCATDHLAILDRRGAGGAAQVTRGRLVARLGTPEQQQADDRGLHRS